MKLFAFEFFWGEFFLFGFWGEGGGGLLSMGVTSLPQTLVRSSLNPPCPLANAGFSAGVLKRTPRVSPVVRRYTVGSSFWYKYSSPSHFPRLGESPLELLPSKSSISSARPGLTNTMSTSTERAGR